MWTSMTLSSGVPRELSFQTSGQHLARDNLAVMPKQY